MVVVPDQPRDPSKAPSSRYKVAKHVFSVVSRFRSSSKVMPSTEPSVQRKVDVEPTSTDSDQGGDPEPVIELENSRQSQRRGAVPELLLSNDELQQISSKSSFARRLQAREQR